MLGIPTMSGQGLRRAGAMAGAAAVGALALAPRSRAAAALLAAGGLCVSWATVRPTNPVLGPAIRSGGRDRPNVALVIAGAPDPQTPAIVQALGEAGVSATFFLIGDRVRGREGAVRLAHDAGHTLANGGFGSDPVAFRGPSRLVRDLRRTERAVAEAVGDDVLARLLMTPRGIRGPGTWIGARSAGYRVVGWTRAARPDELPDARALARRAAGGLEPGAVIAVGPFPDDRSIDAGAAIGAICAEARARGLRVVGLERLLDETAQAAPVAQPALG